MNETEAKDAELDLRNWGRFVFDGWLENNLLVTPPPTSEGYMAPVVAYDEPEAVKMPVDHWSGRVAEHVVVSIGCECGGFDNYRVLVHWYTRLIFLECTNEQRYKRLSKHMHTSFGGALRMHTDARVRYWDRRQVMDGLMKIYKMERFEEIAF